jgi:hypothetical protein
MTVDMKDRCNNALTVILSGMVGEPRSECNEMHHIGQVLHHLIRTYNSIKMGPRQELCIEWLTGGSSHELNEMGPIERSKHKSALERQLGEPNMADFRLL